jgi:hypothetical protein
MTSIEAATRRTTMGRKVNERILHTYEIISTCFIEEMSGVVLWVVGIIGDDWNFGVEKKCIRGMEEKDRRGREALFIYKLHSCPESLAGAQIC